MLNNLWFVFFKISTPKQSNTDKIKHYLTKSHCLIKVLKPSLALVNVWYKYTTILFHEKFYIRALSHRQKQAGIRF